jgi:hypothetical protein
LGSIRTCFAGVALAMVLAAPASSQTQTFTYDALGRLITAATSGGQNNGDRRSYCFDAAGNRLHVKASSDGSQASCVDPGNTSGGPPPPPPPPPPPNTPPTTQDDLASGRCNTTKVVNLVANDTDAESNYPLSLISITRTSGNSATAYKSSSDSVTVKFAPTDGDAFFTYVVQDSLGATATGTLQVYSFVFNC